MNSCWGRSLQRQSRPSSPFRGKHHVCTLTYIHIEIKTCIYIYIFIFILCGKHDLWGCLNKQTGSSFLPQFRSKQQVYRIVRVSNTTHATASALVARHEGNCHGVGQVTLKNIGIYTENGMYHDVPMKKKCIFFSRVHENRHVINHGIPSHFTAIPGPLHW